MSVGSKIVYVTSKSPVAKGPKVENGDGNFSFRLRSRKVEKEGFPESQGKRLSLFREKRINV